MLYDVIIVGSSTSGAFLARTMAEKGFSVKVIERDSLGNVGRKMDIVHIAKADFSKFDLPIVKKGDPEWAFEFRENYTASPSNSYHKATYIDMVGLHMHEYVSLMNQYAERAGAEIEFDAHFSELIYRNGQIVGLKYKQNDVEKSVYGKVVVDCSGVASVVRKTLPEKAGIETNVLTPEDMFYVILRYVKFSEPHINVGWPYHKSWIAPCGTDKNCGILGIGACHSYDYAEEIFEQMHKDMKLPKYEVTRVERGVTPYTRPPYSFVADRFIAAGDAAALTKPNNGEGITSSMVQLKIVAHVLDVCLKKDVFSKADLWQINTEYNRVQGADFAFTRAVLTKAVCARKEEFEYFFKKDIIFCEKFLNGVNEGPDLQISFRDALHIVFGVLGAIFTGKLSLHTVFNLFQGLILGSKLKNHYLDFPATPDGFEKWKQKADKLWNKVGKMQ